MSLSTRSDWSRWSATDVRRIRRRLLFGQLVPDPLPDFEPVLIASLGHLGHGDHRERARDLAIGGCAARTRFEVSLDVVTPAAFAVVVQGQLVFGAMVRHDSWLRSGASATRSFFTARNTLCLAALVPNPSVALISSIDRPS